MLGPPTREQIDAAADALWREMWFCPRLWNSALRYLKSSRLRLSRRWAAVALEAAWRANRR